MSDNGYLEEDDLALYALGLLSGPEASVVGTRLSDDAGERSRAARVQMLLGAYAESTVDLQELPASSMGRLMRSIAQEKSTLQMPPVPASRTAPSRPSSSLLHLSEQEATPKRGALSFMPWLGWAIAAALLVAAGLEYRQGSSLRQTIAEQTGQVQQTREEAANAAHERDALRSEAQAQASAAAASKAEVESVKGESAQLRARTDALRATSDELRAKAASEVARTQQESARASELAATADAAARERDALKNTVAAQASQAAALNAQTAALNAQAANAKQVLDALTDATALRVTLTVPKQTVAPTGRATYVAGRGTLIFTASHLAQVASNKVYQLWLMPSDGSSPVPAGTFVPDAAGNASVVSTQFTKGAAKGFAVTVENAGGSQTPTLPILLAGA